MSSYVSFIPNMDFTTSHSFGQISLKGNTEYVLHNSWAGLPGTHIPLDDNNFRLYNIKIDATNKSILFIRTMGGGDIMFLSALIKLIKDKYPSCKIGFACIQEQLELANLTFGVDQIHSLPILKSDFDSYDFHFDVAGILEGSNSSTNVYDLFLKRLGFDSDENGVVDCNEDYKRPHLKEIDYSPNSGFIGLHLFAHDPIRMMNPQVIPIIYQGILQSGYHPLLFGSEKERELYSQAFPKMNWVISPTFGDLITELSQCEYLIGVDSLLVHLAQAIGIPTIALYGPFPSESRIKYYKNIQIIDTYPTCRCQAHGVGHCPKGFKFSPCLNIDIELITGLLKNKEFNFQPEIEDPIIHQFNMKLGVDNV